MDLRKPASPEELAALLAEASSSDRSVELIGNGSKLRAGGPIAKADLRICTIGLDQVYQYEPKDLTVSVGAGMTYAKFRDMLAADGYMVPLDPPFAETATLGGILAANSSGPRRRGFGTARDLVIGIRFATMEGKLVQSGGMVVKNVAGLDMAKLLIGSLGTLAAIAVVNFKLIPKPAGTRTFLFEYPELKDAMTLRDRILQSVLHPVSIDLLNPVAAGMVGHSGWLLAIGAQGNAAVLDRYQKELAGGQPLEGEQEASFWNSVQNLTERMLASPEAVVVRCSVTLQALGESMSKLPGAVVARAGNGVCYAHLDSVQQAREAMGIGKAVMEFGPADRDGTLEMWPGTGDAFRVMQQVKEMFDSKNLLNRGRLYGRI
ncbi:MAG: FAD-binding oxidoreductase [Acidobacteria bacterium]|nr:FAD-binding oxidoreductase [Acidobacteriota bacterium]